MMLQSVVKLFREQEKRLVQCLHLKKQYTATAIANSFNRLIRSTQCHTKQLINEFDFEQERENCKNRAW